MFTSAVGIKKSIFFEGRVCLIKHETLLKAMKEAMTLARCCQMDSPPLQSVVSA